MSRFDPSASPRPLANSGTAVTPPLPVLAVVPAPVRRNHTSIVKLLAPSRDALPNVT